MQRVREFVDEPGDVFFVSRIDLLPIDDNPGRFGAAQHRKHALDKLILPLCRTMRQILDCFRLPRVTDEIGQQRHERDALARREFRYPSVSIDLQFAHPIDHRHPFRTNMGDLRGVLLK